MRYELFVGVRYLRAKRKEAFVSLITVISTIGLVIGVMTLNIVLSVFTGFEEDLRERILRFNPQIVVHSLSGTIQEPSMLAEKVAAMPEVVAAAPFVYGQAMLSVQQNVTGVVVRGVGPGSEKVIALQQLLKEGSVDALYHHAVVKIGADGDSVSLPAVILGKDVAQQLGVHSGESVNVISPIAQSSSGAMLPRMQRFAVAGIFDSGMAEYDGSLIYMSLPEAQKFFDMEDTATGVEVRVTDPFRAREIGSGIRDSLGFPYRVRDWMELNHNLFAAMSVGKTVYSIVLLLVVIVAAFNIVSTLIMVVMEKRKDIAVLKSMGATKAGVGRIFVYKGFIIGAIGTLAGNVGAVLVCWLLQHYKFVELPRDVYGIDTLKVRMVPEYFLFVTVASLLLCLLATLYPARQAARLSPVDVIRYE